MPISPSMVLATTISASPAQISRSGETSSTCSFATCSPPNAEALLLQLLGLLLGLLDATDHEERLLREVVVLALGDGLEGRDRLAERDVLAGLAGEGLGHVHRVRQEPLDAAGA